MVTHTTTVATNEPPAAARADPARDAVLPGGGPNKRLMMKPSSGSATMA